VLMDLKMPGVNGIQATRMIQERVPTARVLVLTTYDADEWLLDAIRAGAAGYLLKETPRAELIAAVQGTGTGKDFVGASVAGKLFAQVVGNTVVPDSTLAASLSLREREVLRSLALGWSNEEIAKHLFLSSGTVRNHVSSILTKLGASDRTQAAVIALR